MAEFTVLFSWQILKSSQDFLHIFRMALHHKWDVKIGFAYSKVSIKLPVLLNAQVHLRKKLIVLFYFKTAMANFWFLLNNLVWIFGKKSLLNDQYYIFSNFQKARTTRSYNREFRVCCKIQNRVFCPYLKKSLMQPAMPIPQPGGLSTQYRFLWVCAADKDKVLFFWDDSLLT